MLKRVLTGTTLGLILFVLGSAAMDRVLERQARQYQSLIDLFFPLREKVDEIHLLLLQQQSVVERAALGGAPVAELEDASDRFREALSACFTVCFARLEQPAEEFDDSRELLVGLQSIHRAFRDHSRRLTALFDQLSGGSPDGRLSTDQLAEHVLRAATSLQEAVARFEEDLKRHYDGALARTATMRSSVRRLFFAMVGAAILFGTLANVYFYRSLLPLRSMVEAVRDVTLGHYEVRVDAKGGDEVAFLADEFNAMAEALGEQRRAIKRSHAEKLQLERQVRRSEKLSAVGELSLGIAHEVRNPLSTIQMTLHALGKRQDLNRSESERVELALHEVHRLEGLVSSLLDYGRPSDPHVTTTDVAALIERSIDLVQAESARCAVAVILESVDPELPEIQADGHQVIQVLVNLLLNAIQASPADGQVRVRAAQDANGPTGATVSITILDDGPGIDPEELRRIFTPFFTTRRDGTGLGLPVARKIAEAHGGGLTVDSARGRSTAAELRLPVQPIGLQRP